MTSCDHLSLLLIGVSIILALALFGMMTVSVSMQAYSAKRIKDLEGRLDSAKVNGSTD